MLIIEIRTPISNWTQCSVGNRVSNIKLLAAPLLHGRVAGLSWRRQRRTGTGRLPGRQRGAARRSRRRGWVRGGLHDVEGRRWSKAAPGERHARGGQCRRRAAHQPAGRHNRGLHGLCAHHLGRPRGGGHHARARLPREAELHRPHVCRRWRVRGLHCHRRRSEGLHRGLAEHVHEDELGARRRRGGGGGEQRGEGAGGAALEPELVPRAQLARWSQGLPLADAGIVLARGLHVDRSLGIGEGLPARLHRLADGGSALVGLRALERLGLRAHKEGEGAHRPRRNRGGAPGAGLCVL
mmetsp:Transcript_31083/g.99408  ORF Transcript_31083/g.99408 Transcript_31083/m.99408 type:complete len:296 (-) Transcript_31083:287-1174(-)